MAASKTFPDVVYLAHRAFKEYARAAGLDKEAPVVEHLGNTYSAAWLDAFHFLQAHPEVLSAVQGVQGYTYFPKESGL